MMSPLVQVLVVTLLLNFSLVENQKTCGYYWRIYNGNIPTDAVEGGVDAEGNTFYIAQVHKKLLHKLLPGMIIPSKQSALITVYGLVLYVRNDFFHEVKILCSSDKQGFEWVPTTSQTLTSLTGHTLVPGGNVLGHSVYIGRVRYGGGDIVGKVFLPSLFVQGLYVPVGGTCFQSLTFDVLTYDCKNTKREEKKKEESMARKEKMKEENTTREEKKKEENTTTEKQSDTDVDEAINDIFNGL